MAESEGFEPSYLFRSNTLSRRALSTTQPTLRHYYCALFPPKLYSEVIRLLKVFGGTSSLRSVATTLANSPSLLLCAFPAKALFRSHSPFKGVWRDFLTSFGRNHSSQLSVTIIVRFSRQSFIQKSSACCSTCICSIPLTDFSHCPAYWLYFQAISLLRKGPCRTILYLRPNAAR